MWLPPAILVGLDQHLALLTEGCRPFFESGIRVLDCGVNEADSSALLIEQKNWRSPPCPGNDLSPSSEQNGRDS